MSITGLTAQSVSDKLRTSLDTTHLHVSDVSDGCGAKFDALIVSPKFEGIQLLARHRMVNEVLAEEMKRIHAFTMKTLTPQQYEKMSKQSN